MRFPGWAFVVALRCTPIPLICAALIYHTGPAAWIVGMGGSYQRQVEEPTAVVAAALKDIGTDDFDRDGGETGLQFDLPQIVRSETPNGLVWQVLKDGKVTVEMTATLKPANGGAATDVLGSVKLIDGENAMSLRAFQLVFSNALDAKLDEFSPHSGVDEVRAKQSRDAGLTPAAILADPPAIARAGLRAEEDERRVEREMREQRDREDANRGVNFEPGQPMIDVDPDHRRSVQ